MKKLKPIHLWIKYGSDEIQTKGMLVASGDEKRKKIKSKKLKDCLNCPAKISGNRKRCIPCSDVAREEWQKFPWSVRSFL